MTFAPPHVLRALARSPAFALTAVVSLGIAIGTCTAVFAIVKALFFTPLPYAKPDRLVEIWSTQTPASRQRIDAVPAERVRRWLQNGGFRSLETFAARGPATLVLEGEVPERIEAEAVSGAFFETMGVDARIGRTLGPNDDLPGAVSAVVISERLWRERFDGRASALGAALRLEGTSYTVVGVMPARFEPARRVWISASDRLAAGTGIWFPVARLRDGAALSDAVVEVQTRAAAEVAADSALLGGMGAVPVLLGTAQREVNVVTLWVLFGTVGMIFLLALTNLTTIFMVRAAERARGLAVRLALGASTSHLGAALLAESVAVAVAGTVLGLAVAFWTKDALRAALGEWLAGAAPPALDAPAFLFAAVLSLVAAILVGLEPLRGISALDVRGLLQTGGGTTTLNCAQRRTRNVAVAAQVALTTVLACCVGVLFVAHRNYERVDVGFDAERVVVAVPDYELAEVTPEEQEALAPALAARLTLQPGVESVTFYRMGAQSYPPRPEYDVVYEGGAEDVPTRLGLYGYYDVGPDFFSTLGIELVAGRDFGPSDGAGSTAVGIVSRRGAGAWWPGESPIGRRLKLGERGEWITIVGVAEDAADLHELGRGFSIELGRSVRHLPRLYRPIAQRRPTPEGWQIDGCCFFSLDGVVLAARVDDDQEAAAVTEILVRETAELAPGVPLTFAGTLYERHLGVDRYRRLQTFSLLIGSVALVGLLLALLGIAGVVAESIARRTREIGVRKALGATSRAVKLAVARESLVTAAAGLTLGVAAILGIFAAVGELSLYYRSMLVDASPTDARVLTVVGAVILAVSTSTALICASRADKIEPAEALRVD